MGALGYRVWYFAALQYDEDQRLNENNARRQQVQILFAKQQQASSWFNPELLAIPVETVRAWMDADADSRRLPLRDREPVPRTGTRARRGRRASALVLRPFQQRAERQLLGADDRRHAFPVDYAARRRRTTLTYGQYRALLETNRNQEDRAAAYRAFHQTYADNQNTYAALYNGVLQRDWFHARARGYASTLDAALHGDDIPTSVVENLIQVTKAGVEPLRRYHRLRRRVLGVDTLPAVRRLRAAGRARCPTISTMTWGSGLSDSVRPLGREYQQRVRAAFDGRWIDVFENAGKRSGAYSAPVYGAHPYMLLNYNETLDAVFTLAHEMGHSMHTMLSHEAQPFVYAGYTIFVAEVPSTLNEALFLDLMLERVSHPRERAVLLQHAIDSIASTFYTQVMFADFELQAHRLVEQDQPVTADALNAHLRDAVARLLRRCHRRGRDLAAHLGAHSALLQHAVLRLSVRHLLRVDRQPDAVAAVVGRGGACRRRRSLSVAAPRRRQRLPDEAAVTRRCGSESAGYGARRRPRSSTCWWGSWRARSVKRDVR